MRRQKTLTECKHVIFSMKLNKSPGIDGIPVELYRTSVHVI